MSREHQMKAWSSSFPEAVLGAFGTAFAAAWVSLLLITTCLFILKVPIGPFHLLTALVMAWVFMVWFVSRTARSFVKVLAVTVVLFATVGLASIFVSGEIIDVSYDGQAYHQEAIIQLSHGWNPVYMMLDGQATANLERWLNHYPKGIWYFAGAIYKLTDNIESGKALSIMAPIAAFALTLWGLWRVKIHFIFKTLIALAFLFNPVVIYQSLSYYLDGVLVSMLLALLFTGVRIAMGDKKAFWPFLLLTIILVNIKTSAVIFAGILALSIVGYLWLSNNLKRSLKALKFTVLAFIIGVCVVGYNPYVTNFVTKGHPLYPTMGKGAIDYVPGNAPENYWGVAPPVRLFVSIFSYSSLAKGEGEEGKLKLPFELSGDELSAFRETNAKTGGFGPFFGGIFLVATLAAVFYLVFSESNKKHVLLSSIFLIIGSASLVATSSVARYVPYVWWLPVLIALYYIAARSHLAKFVGVMLILLMFINTGLVAYSYFPHNVQASRDVERELSELAQSGGETIKIDVIQFGSTKLKLKKYGISFEEIQRDTKCAIRRRLLIHNITELCTL